MLFNDNWVFGQFGIDESYEKIVNSAVQLSAVDIPHDWLIYDTHDLYKTGIGFYRKHFSVSVQPNHTYILRFGGVYMDCTIYLNGRSIYEWKYGYSTFDVELNRNLNDGDNVIEVLVRYRHPNTRWYSGAGIYRNVYFIDKSDVYIPEDGCYFQAKEISTDKFALNIDCEIKAVNIASSGNSGNVDKQRKVRVVHTLSDMDGFVAARTENEVVLFEELMINHCVINVNGVTRWDIDNPYLYSLKTELFEGDELMDMTVNPCGFRTISVDPDKGFFLNHRRVQINGACMHHDLGALGSAVNINALRRQFAKLKEMGVNSVRTSHNMPAKEVMELADEMGILINSESFDMWERPKTLYDYSNFFKDWWQKDVRSWVRRDRNHPSLIMWSIGNEIYDVHAGNGYEWNRLLRDEVRRYDYMHNALIVSGSNYMEWDGARKCADDLEAAGYNYGERFYDRHHKLYPEWCIFGSETASTLQSRGIYHFPLEKTLLTHVDGQCSSLDNCTTNWGAKSTDFVISMHRDRPFVMGQYIWTGWDYIGEPTPYSTKNSYFGQIDTAGFEKDSFYMYKAEWNKSGEPFAHLMPYWDFNTGRIVDVCAYTNCDSVELWVNERSMGKQYIDHQNGACLKASWKVKYTEGFIKAVAYDKEGRAAASDVKHSFGDPCRIVMRADRKIYRADGEDLIFVTVEVEDKDGYPVENARNRIEVSVSGEGRLVGLDNGDSTDYESYKGSNRKLFSGKLLAIVASTTKPGKIIISACSSQLEPAYIEAESVPCTVLEGISCNMRNENTPCNDDIPIRKIEIVCDKTKLSAQENSTEGYYIIRPDNATFDDVRIKAVTADGVEAHFVEILQDPNRKSFSVRAKGDGEFMIMATANNGNSVAEVVSELEMSAYGLGEASLNPYGFIYGASKAECSADTKLSFEGGVFINLTGEGSISFDNVEFGEYGADKISVSIFSFEDSLPLTVWEGEAYKGEKLGEFVYSAVSVYNTYQDNIFKLKRRIKGLRRISFSFEAGCAFSLKGFCFERTDRTYDTLYAVECSEVYGDSFVMGKDAIEHIGNNVSIEWNDMDFSKSGVSKVTVCAKGRNDVNSIHILFDQCGEVSRRMIEIPCSEEYTCYDFAIEDVRIKGKVSVLFLPGSNVDFKWIRFE